jgi:flagellar brake protein
MTQPAPVPDAQPSASGSKTALELEQQGFSQYLLYSRSEILFVLRSVMQKKCMLTVYFDGGRSFFLTTLLAISDDGNWVYFDFASEPEIARRALVANRLMFTTMLERVKVQFSLDGLQQVSAGNRPAFAGRSPETLLRLQRREHFRLATPVANPLRCIMELPTSGDSRKHELTVLDLSGGGIGLAIPDALLPHFAIGTVFPECRIDLPEEGRLATSLCVRNVFAATNKAGNQYKRAGCEFIDLPGTALTLVQRYITRFEREHKARESGFE